MNNLKEKLLTSNQFTFLIIGFSLGPGFFRLPNIIVKSAKNDAWISTIIGLIYSLYIVFMAIYISNKYPKDTILSLSKNFFGSVFGTILNFLFLVPWIITIGSMMYDSVKLNLVYISGFLAPSKIIFVSITLAAYVASLGLKSIAKICELSTYLGMSILLVSVFALKTGDINNIMPVFNSGFSNILKGTKDAIYYYTGIEGILLFYPFLKNLKDLKKSCLKAVFIEGSIWTWITFITIYYLGVNVTLKSTWGSMLTFQSINIPIINNFRYVFMFAWSLITFRILSVYYFVSVFILNDIIKINIKNWIYILYIPLIILSITFLNPTFYDDMLKIISPTSVIFNILFITSIAIFSKYKNMKNY